MKAAMVSSFSSRCCASGAGPWLSRIGNYLTSHGSGLCGEHSNELV